MHKIQALESLRGIAAFIVFCCHFFNIFSTPQEVFPSYLIFLLNGSAAVYLFFILSGYVLSRRFFIYYSKKALLTAMLKRFFRLFPMVLICSLIAYTLSSVHYFYNFDGQTYFLQDLHIQKVVLESFSVFIDGKHFLNIFWTMRFELIGSLLVFTLIFIAFLNKNQSLEVFMLYSWIILFCIIVFDTLLSLLDGGGGYIFPFRSGIRLLTLFLIGACLSTIHTAKFQKSFSVLFPLCFVVAFYYFFKKQTLLQYTYSNNIDLVEYLLLGGFIVYGSIHFKPIRKILEFPILIRFGQISFAFYALHMIIFGSFGILILHFFQNINIYIFFLMNFAITCACAYPLSRLDIFLISKINYFFSSIFEKSASLPK